MRLSAKSWLAIGRASRVNPPLRADSFLARLPNEDFDAAMAALRAHAAASAADAPVSEDLDWFVFTR
jgi:hypothetical protein